MFNYKHAKAGFPIRYPISCKDGRVCNNFYLMRMDFVVVKENDLSNKSFYQLFTESEIMDAVDRYRNYIEEVIEKRSDSEIGYAYPITYRNKNDVLTTRVFCRFTNTCIGGLYKQSYCALFSPREIRRARERADLHVLHRPISFLRYLKVIWRKMMR